VIVRETDSELDGEKGEDREAPECACRLLDVFQATYSGSYSGTSGVIPATMARAGVAPFRSVRACTRREQDAAVDARRANEPRED
jgi:hypothetical protein